MPSTGWSLRSSVHLSHLESCLLASKIFSILPVSTPPASVMRTSDFSVLPSSSMVFHRPTGVFCAQAAMPASASAPATITAFMSRSFVCVVGTAFLEQRLVHFHQRLQARARAADQARGLGQQLGEVEARG